MAKFITLIPLKQENNRKNTVFRFPCKAPATPLHTKKELPVPLENEVLILSFDVRYSGRTDIDITINGVRNRLSGSTAPYPNRNTLFTYMISQNTPLKELSLPISQGYHAYVDGKKTKPETVNQTFVGFPLKKGTHEVTLSFHAPGKVFGCICSCLAFFYLAGSGCLVIRMASSTGLS